MKQKAYLIRAGHNGVFANEWLEKSIMTIGHDSAGLELVGKSRKQIKDAYSKTHNGLSPRRVASDAGALYRFANEITVETIVVVYDPSTRLYHIGKVAGPCVPADEELLDNGECFVRRVTWETEAPRDYLDTSAKHRLGSIGTLSLISHEVVEKLLEAAKMPEGTAPVTDCADETDDDDSLVVTEEEAIERIKDRVRELSWEDMELLVAGLLRAMGYKTQMTQKGSDGGYDIVASPDGLGLVQPRIIAEVKHRQKQIDAEKIRAFRSALHDASGLYVSTGGFTRNARIEARGEHPIQLLDLDQLVRALVERYEHADDETRRLLPLVRIYLPA